MGLSQQEITTLAAEQPLKQVMRDGVHFTLLGTAHVSKTSAEVVEQMIDSGAFDAVAIELCESRHASLTGDSGWKNLDLFQIIRSGKAGMVMANLALSGYQRRIAEQFGIEPGAEMKAAIESTAGQEIPLQLIDREVGITLKRTYRGVSFWRRMELMAGLIGSMFAREEITEEEIEKLKQGDILESTFSEFAQLSPAIYAGLINERDQFMAARLRTENIVVPTSTERVADKPKQVLAVVGAGHLQGLADYLANDESDPKALVDNLNQVAKPSRWPKLIPWFIVALVLIGFYIGFSRGREEGVAILKLWTLFNSGLAALGALLARAHPITTLTAAVASPITSLNPTVGTGMVTAPVEAWLRKPNVSDLENLRDDTTSLKGWYKNPATRVLLVFALTSLGSALGFWLGGASVLQRLWG